MPYWDTLYPDKGYNVKCKTWDFAMVPDYWIKVDRIVSEGNAVILFGSAGGTFVAKGGMMKPENKWETPAVWRALVKDERVAEWRVYCDNEPIREKMRAAAS
jgi:ketosteroid isomerase-like protein